MSKKSKAPAPYDTLELNDQVIWSDSYNTLSPFQKFKAKTMASSIEYVRQLTEFDYKTVTAEELIAYVKTQP